jgi:dihydroxyacetone kinase-like protein
MADQLTLHGTREWVRGFAERVIEHADELTALDAAVGDADHGPTCRRSAGRCSIRLDDPRSDIGACCVRSG